MLRILIEKGLELDLTATLKQAIQPFGERIKAAGLLEQVQEFIFDRLRARYEDSGIDVQVYQSVRAIHPVSPLDFDQRVQAVQSFVQLPEAQALAAANKRVSNLLGKSDNAQQVKIEPRFFDTPAEFSLYSALQQAEQATQSMREQHQYSQLLTRLASLQEPVDRFFDDVMVNAEHADIRNNRHALLAQLRSLFLVVADISVLD